MHPRRRNYSWWMIIIRLTAFAHAPEKKTRIWVVLKISGLFLRCFNGEGSLFIKKYLQSSKAQKLALLISLISSMFRGALRRSLKRLCISNILLIGYNAHLLYSYFVSNNLATILFKSYWKPLTLHDYRFINFCTYSTVIVLLSAVLSYLCKYYLKFECLHA